MERIKEWAMQCCKFNLILMPHDRLREYYWLSYARCQKGEAIYLPGAPLLSEPDEVQREPAILSSLHLRDILVI